MFLENLIACSYIKSFSKVNIKELIDKGCNLFIFDVDGTLTAHHSTKIQESIEKKLMELIGYDHEINKVLLSSCSDKRYIELHKILGTYFDYIYIGNKLHTNDFIIPLNKFKTRPEKAVMIGDQLKDMYIANRLGIHTIMVYENFGHGGPFSKRMQKAFEKIVYKSLRATVYKKNDLKS